MLYFKVKLEYDNTPIYRKVRDTYYTIDGILIGGELFTEKERKNLPFPDNYFEQVEISPRRTFCNFGARFEMA